MRVSKIKELVKIVESHDIEEIEISKWWGSNIKISKSASKEIVKKAEQTSVPKRTAQPKEVKQQQETKQETEEPEEKQTSEGVEIKSPIVGTFYRAPAPDADPFVEVGDSFQEGDTLCVVEAMKVMNEIEAEFSGEVIDILVENSEPVEYEEPLFLVKKK